MGLTIDSNVTPCGVTRRDLAAADDEVAIPVPSGTKPLLAVIVQETDDLAALSVALDYENELAGAAIPTMLTGDTTSSVKGVETLPWVQGTARIYGGGKKRLSQVRLRNNAASDITYWITWYQG